MSNRFPEQGTIWLTGASSGIGKALAKHLSSHGHSLIVTGRRQQPLEQLAESGKGHVTPAPCDTTDPQSLDGVREVLEQHRPVTMAILNAGTCEYLDVADFSSDIIEKNVVTNVIGTARSIETVLPSLRNARARGYAATLVIVGSSAWWFPFGRAEGYGASKAALAYLATSLRADLAAEGIDVVLVSPGFVKTPLTDRNDFPMPFLVSAEEAAGRIVQGLEKGRNSIEFPRRFTWLIRLLGNMPQGVIDRMAASMSRSQEAGKESAE
ncbi:SDR family NAD(P)-dependent oxidoreductase [Marinobacter sp.]|jgi:short-subunit dehydrogenase|uniref:SDR family NAD(P)-dependent oxidoreductase n=1 Tax=Marinobacter sp. TaxID=50741 RepID=UPI0019BCD2D2|nr:SDR family NAD(P)-dependent oxidoreductase [Marinobacter sp.]MBC7190917.1 SDR family NAD(P)-dependent oxidoreductase [Marinobacter sp.]